MKAISWSFDMFKPIATRSNEPLEDKTISEQPQSSGTTEIPGSAVSNASNVELKRRDSLVSETSVYSAYGSLEREEATIRAIGKSIWSMAITGEQVRSHSETKAFEGAKMPRITLGDYLCRAHKYINKLFPECRADECVTPGFRSIIMGVVYLDRLLEKPKRIQITQFNIHRLCMTAVIVAAKYLEDEALPNNYLASVAGIPKPHLGQLETIFCCSIEFDLRIAEDEFLSTYTMLLKSLPANAS